MEEAKTSGNLHWFKKMINSTASDSGSLHWYLIEYMNFLLHFPLPLISSHRHVLKVLKLRFILSPPLTHFSHILLTYTVFIWWKMASVSVKRADVSRGSPSSSLWRWAKARNVGFRNSLRWPIYIINSVDKTRLSCYTPLLTLHHCFFRKSHPLFAWVIVLVT